MAKYLFVLLNDRLGSLDVIVPVVHGVKKKNPDTKVVFVFMEDRTYSQLERDPFLFDTVDSLVDGVVRLRWESSGVLRKAKFLVQLIPLLLKIMMAPDLIFLHCHGVSSRFMKLLLKFTKLKGGRFFEYPKQHVPIFPRPFSEEPYEGDEGDGYLCFSKKDLNYLRHEGRTKVHPVGYPRMMQSWLDYVGRTAPDYILREFADIEGRDVVVVFLGSTVEGIFGMDEQKEWIRVVVNVLRKAIPEAFILLKPHPTSKPEIMEDLLHSIALPRVKITYMHVAVLSHTAKFVISRHSSTIVDGLAAGCSVIQYQKFTPAWMKVHPEKSIYPQLGAILTESETELEQTVKIVLDGLAVVPDVNTILGHVEDLNILVK